MPQIPACVQPHLLLRALWVVKPPTQRTSRLSQSPLLTSCRPDGMHRQRRRKQDSITGGHERAESGPSMTEMHSQCPRMLERVPFGEINPLVLSSILGRLLLLLLRLSHDG